MSLGIYLISDGLVSVQYQSNRIDALKQDSIRCHKVIREQNTILKNVHKNCVVMGEWMAQGCCYTLAAV